MAMPSDGEPPDEVGLTLDEALDLLAALEDARDVLFQTDHFSVLVQVETGIQVLGRRLGIGQGGSDAD